MIDGDDQRLDREGGAGSSGGRYAENRKIGPDRKIGPSGDLGFALKPDGTPDDNDRVEIGPTQLAFDEWAAAGLTAPNLTRLRAFRLKRLAEMIRARDLGGVLLCDPLNIRYASDTTNMQLWNAHNFFRACFVSADGYMILWDYKGEDLHTSYNPLVRETRDGAGFFYFLTGDKSEDTAGRFAREIADVMREHCGDNRRLGVDKVMPHGLTALKAAGVEICDGEECLERSRSIKGPDEILAMRCAIHACAQSLHAMRQEVRPGITEVDAWSVMQAENFKRGGEWIETRLLSSGPRTNPWMQECGPRVLGNNEIFAFDTDMIGCYGMCSDISRTWFIGDGEPTAEHKNVFREAHAQIVENMALLKPGVRFADLSFGGRQLPPEYVELRYGVKMHGVGLCDEWPAILYPQDYIDGAFDYALEPGMTLCVEVYLGAKGGGFGVKLEDQVLITEDGYENLTKFPFDERLLV